TRPVPLETGGAQNRLDSRRPMDEEPGTTEWTGDHVEDLDAPAHPPAVVGMHEADLQPSVLRCLQRQPVEVRIAADDSIQGDEVCRSHVGALLDEISSA